MLKVSVYRYNPDQDAAPFMQEFEVDTGGKDLMVLDVLALIKEQDEGFSYRRSCREGVCGSDGMNINGKNGLACVTPLSAVVKKVTSLVIRPLPGLPVIRDLVVDMSIFYKQYEKVKPFLQNDTPARPSNVCNRQKSVKSSTVCTSASCALAARLRARPSGGTRTSSWALLHCCKPTVSWLTAVTPRPASVWLHWMTRSAYSAAAGS
jgi:succinate dehydrogenase/fumarate reductase iron-sulfur protein